MYEILASKQITAASSGITSKVKQLARQCSWYFGNLPQQSDVELVLPWRPQITLLSNLLENFFVIKSRNLYKFENLDVIEESGILESLD